MMLQDDTKCNMAAVKTVSKQILQKRWWNWVLSHPGLGPEYIHPDRTMHTSPGITQADHSVSCFPTLHAYICVILSSFLLSQSPSPRSAG